MTLKFASFYTPLIKPLDPTDECTRHFDPLHLINSEHRKHSPFAPRARLQTHPVALGLCKILGLTLHPWAKLFLDSPSPTRAKGGGGRHATPAVSPFVYVGLVSVVE